MDRDAVLANAKKVAAVRIKAKARLDAAEHAEDIAIQDAYKALGPGYGTATDLAGAFSRSREHIRRVINPDSRRGHYAATSTDSTVD